MDDTWEDDATPSTGFGGGFGRGFGGAGRGGGFSNQSSGGVIKKFGVGRSTFGGGGFGSMNGDSDRKPGQGRGRGSSGGGFGGGGQTMSNGFGSSSTATNEDWGDSGGFGTGGGMSSTGFGGGGFGSSSGQSGGFSSERKGGSGGGGGCYKCGQDGHFARECPNSDGGGGGGFGAKKSGSGCFKCGEEGHFSRECPSSGGGGGGFGGGERKKGCFKCGEDGHMARDCPSAESGGGGFGGDRKRGCFKCGEEGHMSRECPTGGGGGGSRGGGFGSSDGGDKKTGCFKCGEEGHFSRECPTATEGEGPRTERYVPPPPPEDEENIFHADVVKGINFDKYDDIQVECTGEGSTKTGISSFMQCDLHPSVQDNVNKAKYDKPTPVQKFAIPFTLKERDIMACAQTGSGKTAAFLVPIISSMLKEGIDGSQFSEVQAPRCVIVGPTRELVLQIRDQARKFSYGTMLRPVVVYGGTSVQSQLSDVYRGTHILIGTPGRLLDFIEKGKVSLARVKYLVLDEADRMLDMGFSPSIRKLVRDLGMPSKMERQTLMFSATFPEEIQKLAREFLNNYIFITVGRVGGANEDICQTIYRVSRTDKREKLVSILNDQGSVDRVLIFVEQKRQADFLASYLSQSGYTCTSIHGDRLQREREEALKDFKRAVAPVLVATSVAARGLDISDVKHVVNFDLPSAIEDYVHRIGRTGRCGNMGKATSFYDPDDNKDLARPLVKILQDAHQEVPDWLEEDAEHQLGTGFSGLGGKYGGKDARAGKFGGGGDDSWDTGASSSGGFGGGAAVDDESWD